MSTQQTETKTKGMCIATRCTSVDQFVQMFHRFVDEHSFFVSTLNTRPPGLETSFSVQLADGTPVLRGLCVVQQAWTTSANPFKSPGVRLAIKRLTAQSTPVFERLLASRSAAKKPPTPPALATVVIPKPGTPPPTPPKLTGPLPTVRAAPEPGLDKVVVPPRATTGDAIPRAVTVETTDVMDEKTDVRPTKLPPGTLPPASQLPPLDIKEVARPLAPAEPVHDAARTPGSELVLPANPLMNLSDESLEGYVDCTLYEETGTFFPADDDTAFPDDEAPPPVPARADEASASDSDAALARGSAPVLPTPIATQTREEAAPTESDVEPVAAPQLPLAPPAHDSMPIAMAPSIAASPVLVPTRRKLPRSWLIGGGAGALAIATLGIVIATGSSDGAGAPTPAAAKPTTRVVAADGAPTAEQQVARPGDEGAADPAARDGRDEPDTEDASDDRDDRDRAEERTGDGPPVVGSGPCKVEVHSTPAGSIVKLDGASVGPSPLTIAASCDKHKIEVVHPRYAPQVKLVTLEAGEAKPLDITLSRPTHVVTLTSNPSGAQIFIDGRRAGTTPTKLSVLGFITLKVEVKKLGYQPARVKLYSKKSPDAVSVRLQKW